MNAIVSTLYKNGKRVANGRVGATVTGDLNMGVSRTMIEASVVDENGTHLLTPLIDAFCDLISANGLYIKGVELVNGREVAQEWWCKVEQKDMP